MRVLLVYKRSARAGNLERALALKPASRANRFIRADIQRIRAAAEVHRRTLETVRRMLSKAGVRFKSANRVVFERPRYSFDGVISVGGDGTFLEAARAVDREWILGVNSDPARSVGSFCLGGVEDLPGRIDRIRRGRAAFERLHRFTLEMDGKPLGVRVLNDVLITHAKPAAMSRYWLEVGKRREAQRSSGLWVSTAAGSTGAVRSAGGRVLPRGSARIQYRPRELYGGHRGPRRYRLTGGTLSLGTTLFRIGSLMKRGMICVDGEHWVAAFPYGSVLTLRPSAHLLRVVR